MSDIFEALTNYYGLLGIIIGVLVSIILFALSGLAWNYFLIQELKEIKEAINRLNFKNE